MDHDCPVQRITMTKAPPRKAPAPPLSTKVARADAGGIRMAAAVLRKGGLVAFPTETVYGLGADATNPQAVAALYAAKGRPAFNPLIAHVADLASAERLGLFDAAARDLAGAFWPGPLTLVVPARSDGPVCDLARAGLSTIALRVPSHPLARKLIAAVGRPIVAPSANRSGHVSPTAAGHVLADLQDRIDLILNGGTTDVGVESTIVACTGGPPVLLRAGGVPREVIAARLGYPLGARGEDDGIRAPGQLASHYAPRSHVRLNAATVAAGDALLAFGPILPPGSDQATAILNLSPTGNMTEAAANLFAHLRMLDGQAATIAVMPVPMTGLGEAINDRLARAAAERS
jgi:L-threonylcarbamoyladenylate synthase